MASIISQELKKETIDLDLIAYVDKENEEKNCLNGTSSKRKISGVNFITLTKSSIRKISNSKNNENEKSENQSAKRNRTNFLQNFKSDSKDTKQNVDFLTENKLPKRYEFPSELFGKPIEEIDKFHKHKNVSY